MKKGMGTSRMKKAVKAPSKGSKIAAINPLDEMNEDDIEQNKQ